MIIQSPGFSQDGQCAATHRSRRPAKQDFDLTFVAARALRREPAAALKMEILPIVDWIRGRIAGIGARFGCVTAATAVLHPPGVGDNVGGALEPDRCVFHRRI